MALVIYARKSSESEDRQVQSLEDQLSVLRQVADREGLRVKEEIVEARSAKDPYSRPAFQLMIGRIESGDVTGILTWHVNRLSRNMIDGGIIAHYLQSGKLQFIKTPERTYTPEDSALLLAIENGMSTSFIHDLRKGVLRGMKGRAERGWMPARAPLGYRNDLATSDIVREEPLFSHLQEAWNMLSTRQYSIAEVKRLLEAKGMRHPKGGYVSRSRFYCLFRNPFYYGEFSWRGITYQGKHEPMVNQQTFQEVQRFLDTGPAVVTSKYSHTYAGIFKCPICGCQITPEVKIKEYKTTQNSVKYTYYHCTGAKGCSRASVPEQLIDNAVDGLFIKFRDKNWLKEWAMRELAGNDQSEENQKRLGALGTEIERLRSRLRKLRAMRLDDDISESDYREDRIMLEDSLQSLEREYDSLVSGDFERERDLTKRSTQLEELHRVEELTPVLRRWFLTSIVENCYLTLEKATFAVSSTLLALLAFEPTETCSDKANYEGTETLIPAWWAKGDSVQNLIKQQIRNNSSVQITITLEESHTARDSRAPAETL